jgi:anhydro-N-acetylmuramic acid kinase
LFSRPAVDVAVLNLGGIANLSLLPSLQRQQAGHPVLGFDCGPGNALMDVWCERNGQGRYDAEGRWAATGDVHVAWLDELMREPYFSLPPPKSTGRDLFDQPWLDRHLNGLQQHGQRLKPQDVQATLTELTARTVAEALLRYSPDCSELLVCGGGALNADLMQRIRQRLPSGMAVKSTQAMGIPVDQVEALAFAWLARARLERQPGNLPAVTGASAARVLGAVYAATAQGELPQAP